MFLEALLAEISSLMCQTLRPSTPESSASGTITDMIRYLNEHLQSRSLDDFIQPLFHKQILYEPRIQKATTSVGLLNLQGVVMARQLMLTGFTASRCGQ